MKWIVTHYHQNPRHNKTLTFDNRKDAVVETRLYHSDDKHPGMSGIESEDGQHRGERYWNHTRISWTKARNVEWRAA